MIDQTREETLALIRELKLPPAVRRCLVAIYDEMQGAYRDGIRKLMKENKRLKKLLKEK